MEKSPKERDFSELGKNVTITRGRGERQSLRLFEGKSSWGKGGRRFFPNTKNSMNLPGRGRGKRSLLFGKEGTTRREKVIC